MQLVQKSMKNLDVDKWIAEKLDYSQSDDEASAHFQLEYESLQQDELKELFASIKKDLDTQQFRVSGQNDNGVWEKGWGEVYKSVTEQGVDKAKLNPQYFGKYPYLRLDGTFIKPSTKNFEAKLDQCIRQAVFTKFLAEAKRVVELGCGTGNSLYLLNKLFPQMELVGADWASASQHIIAHVASTTGANLRGVNFNMLTMQGWDELSIDHTTAILTVHALEQLGSSHEQLVEAIVKAKPSICVHIEPILENYEQGNTFDELAIDYHYKRNYLNGWLTYLKKKEQEGLLNVLVNKRIGFGGVYHEAYSVVVWQVV